jgi:type IV secretion system protein VirD4
MGVRARLVCLGIGAAIGLAAGTQFVAAHYDYHRALGWGLEIGGGAKIYPPWDILVWSKQWASSPSHGPVMRAGAAIILLGIALGAMLVRLFDLPDTSTNQAGGDLALRNGKPVKSRGWGDVKALRKAGLTGDQGVVFGRTEPESWLERFPQISAELLVSPDLRPVLVTGGTRSGKGRGVVVPSLLNWSWSTLVFDPKSELWATTAGHRSTLGPALFFNPRSRATARFNPLAEIAPGSDAVGQVIRLVELLAEPGTGAPSSDIWDKLGKEMLGALMLHVLFSAEPNAKNLITVKALSADLDDAAAQMLATRHIRKSESEAPICHPHVAQIARSYAATHEKGRKSVQMTVRSYLAWIAGDEIENAISASDFRIGDLMCAALPVSLYVQIAPGDLKALQPLVRLFFHQAATAFTTHLETDSDGRPKENALLMVLDEFPLLGKVSFFEDVVRLSAGFGIKCLFVAQSLNDIARIYGPLNGFLDNAAIYVAFAALDPTTREKVSRLTGTVKEMRISASLPHHFSDRGGSRTISDVDRPLMDLADVGALPDDRQLVFIAGHRPYLLPKLRYDKVGWMALRARLPAPRQGASVQTPELPSHPWADIRDHGRDPNVNLAMLGDHGNVKRYDGGLPSQPAQSPAPTAKNDPPKPDPATSEPAGSIQVEAPRNSNPTLAAVRRSWPIARASRRTADIRQSEFDFAQAVPEQPADEPANDPANPPDLLDILHGGC